MLDISRVVLVCDMDGTLLNSKKEITPSVRAAIKRFTSLGGRFTVATGRTIQSFQHYFNMLELDYPLIMFNGSMIYDKLHDTVLYSTFLPENSADISIEIMSAMPHIGGEVLKTDCTIVFRNNEYEEKHTRICGITPIYKPLEEIEKGDWQKVLFAMSPDDIPKIMALARSKNYKGVQFVKSADIFFEMIPEGITKGSALKKYRQLDNMQDCFIVAAGDYDNDIEMLIEADIGAAPANAQPEAKAAADIVLKHSCDEDAMAELIEIILKKCGFDSNKL